MKWNVILGLSTLACLLWNCKVPKVVQSGNTREITYSCDDNLLVDASFECFYLMLMHDSLQPYYHLCLNELDSCKPTLFIDRTRLANLWKNDIGPATEWCLVLKK